MPWSTSLIILAHPVCPISLAAQLSRIIVTNRPLCCFLYCHATAGTGCVTSGWTAAMGPSLTMTLTAYCSLRTKFTLLAGNCHFKKSVQNEHRVSSSPLILWSNFVMTSKRDKIERLSWCPRTRKNITFTMKKLMFLSNCQKNYCRDVKVISKNN